MVNIEDNPLYYATIGGIIIGISTSINYLFRGTVTGISGILYGTVTLDKNQMPKNLAIIGGMFIASGVFFDIFQYGTFNKFTPFGPEYQITQYTSQLGFALAGVLVGFGTKLSNGCTSGHGLCGLARLSIRSFVAVITFLISGLAISTIIYHAGGLGPFTQKRYSPIVDYNHSITANICIALGVLLPLIGLYIRRNHADKSILQFNQSHKQTTDSNNKFLLHHTTQYLAKDQIIVFLVGLIFGLGLLVAGMVRRSNVIMFLALGKDWNPSLMFVLGAGVMINLVVFTYMIKFRKVPLFGEKLFNPNNTVIDWKLVGGAICFGIGWGIGGLCPGPALMQSSIFTIDVHLIWFPFFFLGQFMANRFNQLTPSDPNPQNSHNSHNPNNHHKHAQQHNRTRDLKEDLPDLKHNQQIQKTCSVLVPNQNSQIKLNIQNSPLKQNLKTTQINHHMTQILHQKGQGFTHANKLPALTNQKSSNDLKQLKNNNIQIQHIH